VVWTDELRPGLSKTKFLRIVGIEPTEPPLDTEFKDMVGESIDSGMAFEVDDGIERHLFFVFTGISGQRHLVQQLDQDRFAYFGTTVDQGCEEILTAPMISTKVH